MLDCTLMSLCVGDRRNRSYTLLRLGQPWTLLVCQEKEPAYAAGGTESLVHGGAEPLESWLATYRRNMWGNVQSAAALVAQLFEFMLGKHATLH